MAMSEKERQAVEKAAKRYDMLTSIRTIQTAFEAGAKFAMSELNKPSEEIVEHIASLIEADLLQSYAPNFYDEDDEHLSLIDLFSHTDTVDSGVENIKKLVDGMDSIEEIAKLTPFQMDAAIGVLESIKKDASRLHSGNVAHQKIHIMANAQYLIDKIQKDEKL